MELFREEYLISKGLKKNWGKDIYESMKARELEQTKLNVHPHSLVGLSKSLQAALTDNLNVSGSLNATKAIQELKEDELCEFFARYPNVSGLVMTNWNSISEKVMRCISIVLGEKLEMLDLSYSGIDSKGLEVLLARVQKLRVIKLSGCYNLNGMCMGLFAKLCGNTINEVYVDKCHLFKVEPLMYMGGCIGFNAPKLGRLIALDLAECPVEDKGLVAIAAGMKKLRFINLESSQGVSIITDMGVCPLILAGKSLELINLGGCPKLTNKTACAIAANCPNLRSLNVYKCNNISDMGINAVLVNCKNLQALNVAGLLKLKETILYNISQSCPGMMMLNITGCEQISTRGLKALIEGLKFVELAVSFFGFKPKDQYIEKRMTDHLNMIQDSAVQLIKDGLDKRKKKKKLLEDFYEERKTKAADTIKQYFARYVCRMYWYRKWQVRLSNEHAVFIQRCYRGYKGRSKASVAKGIYLLFIANTPYAIKMQKCVRGHLVRLKAVSVFKAIREMYDFREREACGSIAVRFQANGRRFLARQRVKALKELWKRRGLDERNAATVMNTLVRFFLAGRRVRKIRNAKKRLDELMNKSAWKIQKWFRYWYNYALSKLSGKELQAKMRGKWQCALNIQRCFRGFKARERCNRLRIWHASRAFAAIEIQRIYRGSKILHWSDMRLNVIAAYALDRQYIERRDRIHDSRLRYQMFIQSIRRDSASDEEDEEDFDYSKNWIKHQDFKRKTFYWVNDITKEVTYDEPLVPHAHEKDMLNLRIKVFWIVQGTWYDGTITDYHRRKHRHRVEYDDGDHEWVDLDKESERVQVMKEDGSWVMYNLYKTPAAYIETKKVENKLDRDAFKKQAWEDVTQWKIISDDHKGTIIFMSQNTGELRTGSLEATEWIIDDDGHGLPCFYNVSTQETVFEDPRFIHDTDVDLNKQRAFIMQECRYATYFCKALWEQYVEACEMNDSRAQILACLKAKKSNKVKHLNSFTIRAIALYKGSSVLDQPTNITAKQEIEYAQWLSKRMSEMVHRAHEFHEQTQGVKKEKKKALLLKSGKQYICSFCKRETKRELQFCANCGKKQTILLDKPSDYDESLFTMNFNNNDTANNAQIIDEEEFEEDDDDEDEDD